MHKAYVALIPYYRTLPFETHMLECESLCSMLVRISRDHLLPVSLVLEHEFGLSLKPTTVRNVVSALLFPDMDTSYRLTKFVEKTAFSNHPWKGCTFRSLSECLDLTTTQPLKSSKAWCPLCYSEDAATSVCYDRLYWSFSEIDTCRKHGTRLASICYYCGARQNEIQMNYQIGCCDGCGRFLGLEHYYVKSPPPLARPERDAFLKECFLDGGRAVARARLFAKWMRETVGSTSLAQTLLVGTSYLNSVLSFDTRPSFNFCLYAVELYGCWVKQGYDYFSQQSGDVKFDSLPIAECIDIAEVKKYLDRILAGELPVNTRDSIADKMGVTNSFLVTHFPEETAEITRMLQSLTQSNRPDDAMKQQLRQALSTIKATGHQLKWETVIARLPDEVVKNARARDIHKAIRHIERGAMSQAARKRIKRKQTVA